MSILGATSGTHIRLVRPNDGYDSATKRVSELLTEGSVYTVDHMCVGSYLSVVLLVEVPGEWFNTIHFDEVETEQGKQCKP